MSFKAQVKKKTGPLVDHKLCPSCFSKVYCFRTWKLDFLDYGYFDWLTKNKQEQEYQFQPNQDQKAYLGLTYLIYIMDPFHKIPVSSLQLISLTDSIT